MDCIMQLKKQERKNKMTVKELIEELKEIDKKYLDHEIVIYNNASGDKYYISDIGKENEWEDEEEIYITVS
jgi:phage terminase large subunit-like protein